MPNVIIPGVSCIALEVPVTPGISSSRPFQLRAAGTLATSSPLNTACRVAFCTSTTGVSPATVIVSSSPPTDISVLTVTVPDPLSSMPVRATVLNPGSVNVSVYVPGRRSTMRYWPVPSVTTERTFSISAGLAASTVTPGRTAPDGSLTTPASACAWTMDGSEMTSPNNRSTLNTRSCMRPPGRQEYSTGSAVTESPESGSPKGAYTYD